jgi:hypothetical protein
MVTLPAYLSEVEGFAFGTFWVDFLYRLHHLFHCLHWHAWSSEIAAPCHRPTWNMHMPCWEANISGFTYLPTFMAKYMSIYIYLYSPLYIPRLLIMWCTKGEHVFLCGCITTKEQHIVVLSFVVLLFSPLCYNVLAPCLVLSHLSYTCAFLCYGCLHG